MATTSSKPGTAIKNDIESIRAKINDDLVKGDYIFSADKGVAISSEVLTRNKELRDRKNNLNREIKKKLNIIDSANRDFTDVKDALPEKYTPKALNVIEDYTIAVLMIAYIFMVFAVIYYYIILSGNPKKGLIVGTIGGLIFSLVIFGIFYLLA